MEDLRINDRIVLLARDLTATAVRASGPGGQNVNKVATSVELRFDLRRSADLRDEVKARLAALAGRRLTLDGELVLTCQAQRSQAQNLATVRQRLAELVSRALEPPKPRLATRPTKGSVERRLDEKRRRGDRLRQRGGWE